MYADTIENGIYKSYRDGTVILTIAALGNNQYRAVNLDTDITAEVVALDNHRTQVRCIEHKRKGKDGKYRKTAKLLRHNLCWLLWILEEKGFIRKSNGLGVMMK